MAENPEFQASPFEYGGGSASQRASVGGALIFEWRVKGNPAFFRGRFNVYVGAMHNINRRRALLIQETTAELIHGSLKRPRVSTGRLVAATMNPRNVHIEPGFSTFGYAVGIRSWLDSSPAKYWRTIEEGSARAWRRRSFVGMVLPYGRWGNSLAGWYENRWGRQPLAGPPFTLGGRQGKLRPFPGIVQAEMAMAETKRAVVKNPIEPMLAYRRAYDSVGGSRSIRDEWYDAIRRNFIPKTTFPTRGELEFDYQARREARGR